MGLFASCFLPEIWSWKCRRWFFFFLSSVDDSNNNNNNNNNNKTGTVWKKIFRWIWKISFSTFGKRKELLGSKVQLSRCQTLKIQVLVFFADSVVFLLFLPSIYNSNSKAYINHTIFHSPKLWLVPCYHQQKIQKMSPVTFSWP